MARPASSPTARRNRLAKAFERAKQIACGEVLTSVPMAKLVGVNWTTLRGWCQDLDGFAESGVFVAGDKGINYTFEPRATILWLERYFTGDEAEKEKINSRHRLRAGVEVPESEATASIEETKGLVSLTLATFAANEKMGAYVVAADEASFLEGAFEKVVNSILGVTTLVDPNGALPAEVRALNDDYLRGIANTVHASVATHIAGIRAGIQQGGTGRSG